MIYSPIEVASPDPVVLNHGRRCLRGSAASGEMVKEQRGREEGCDRGSVSWGKEREEERKIVAVSVVVHHHIKEKAGDRRHHPPRKTHRAALESTD